MFLQRMFGIRKVKKRKDFSVPEGAKERPNQIYYQMAGKKRRAHASWYRGENTNFHPVRASLSETDAFEKYVGLGWLPDEPFISRQHYITAFGSCFASHITKFLLAEGYRVFGKEMNLNAHIVRSGEGIVNTAAVLQQFEWAYSGYTSQDDVWYNKDGSVAEMSQKVKDSTRQIFEKTDVFIITFGLSEVWHDQATGAVFWGAVPKHKFDPKKHGFRVLGPEENRRNLQKIYELIRYNKPNADIIFTLSPVPLAATFRPISCVTANSVSKASLRIAIDEMLREYERDSKLYYFPSYDFVTGFLQDAMDDDLRHPKPEAIEFIMSTFQRHFLI